MKILDTPKTPKPATAETEPRAPGSGRLPGDIRLGPVRLQVGDLERSLAYYQNVIGLRLLERRGTRAQLGVPGPTELVELVEHRGALPAPDRARTGLFHFALLLPDRPSLGRLLRHLVESGERVGSADHLVSEALYLQDPDNLGIEVYVDRPRSAWRWVGDEVVMVTEPLDSHGLLSAGADEPWDGLPEGTVMGHLHLRVGDLANAASFYSEGLGFDAMNRSFPGALFLGAGGYHHQLGTNTWAGRGAEPPSAAEAQLLEWTIELPARAGLEAIETHLGRQGIAFERHGPAEGRQSLRVRDPWGTALRLSAPAAHPNQRA